MVENLAVVERFRKAQSRLVVQSSDLSLGTISEMVDKKAIDIAPKYQRRERWGKVKQAALIESFLLNIPVPPIYLSEDEYGSYSVVDGKQRVTAIWLFLTDQLQLNALEDFKEINGLKYSELPLEMQNALSIRPYVRVISLLRQSDPSLKFEVFIRLNRGGESMNPQELRNVAYQGNLNNKIYDLARSSFLRKQMKIKDDKASTFQSMQDAELVLRFFALMNKWDSFSGDYRREMDNFMAQNIVEGSEHIEILANRFDRALRGCEKIWGDLAFRRPDGDNWRDQLLNGLYDAEMIAVDLLSEESLNRATELSEEIITKTKKLFENRDFDASVRQGTNSPEKIRFRVQSILEILK
jgi:Protein of unknown function DUF262